MSMVMIYYSKRERCLGEVWRKPGAVSRGPLPVVLHGTCFISPDVMSDSVCEVLSIRGAHPHLDVQGF